MRTLLIVGMPDSVHTARICRSAVQGGWRVYLFPSYDASPHPEMEQVTLFDPSARIRPSSGSSVVIEPVAPRAGLAAAPLTRALSLAAVIRRLRPAVIHAQEIQHSGYLVAAAARWVRRMPPVILSSWGSDLSLQALLPSQRRRIVETFRHVDVLTGECERELWHARTLGYTGETVMPGPIAGGFDLARLAGLRSPGPTSARRTIALKGYQGWAGRAQVGLRALERCGQALRGYRLAIYLAGEAEASLALDVARATGAEVEVVSAIGRPVPHESILAMHGRSRMSIGLSIADGISTSFLEAMVMGAFPIQSGSACANEWLTDGVSGLIVPAEDPALVAGAVRRALEDDGLVDRATAINDAAAQRRLREEDVRARMMRVYDRVAAGAIVRAADVTRVATAKRADD